MAQSVVKGNVALTIDEAELEASLSFTPDAEGAEWNAEKIQRLVMDSRLSGFSQKKAEDLLAKFARSKGPVTEILATGQAPVAPVPEEVEWEELAPPPELASLVEESLLSAPPPELYKTRIENIKVEKTVKKPAALPFLPPKIEKIETVERKESRERVYPDLELVKKGFARRGEKLGSLFPAKPGKAGKTIFGRPIQAEIEDSGFILGRGIARAKNGLEASIDGILRSGSRWAELIPFSLPGWEVRKSADGATFSLSYRRGDPRLPRPMPNEILAKAAELGAPEGSLLPAEELASALEGAGQGGAGAPCEGEVSINLSLDRDARVEVKVDPEGLRATLSIWKGRGSGKPLALAAVSSAVTAARLKGIKVEEFKKTVLEFYKSDKPELLDYLLAEGKAPSRGKDRGVGIALAFMPDDKAAELKGRLLAHPSLATLVPSLADFPIDETSRFALVAKEQRIGELSAQLPGQDGLDVHGAPIPSLPGNDPIIHVFEGVDFAKGVLSASRSGILVAAEKEGVWSFRVLAFRDALIEASLSPDSMTAFLSLRAEEGLGGPLSAEAALAALAEKGVVKGIDGRAVGEAVAEARAGAAVVRRPVASGRPAAAPGSPRPRWVHPAARASLLGGALPEGPLARVAAGEALLVLEKEEGAGEAGYDVKGTVLPIPAADPDARPLEHDASIKEAPGEGGKLTFLAAVSGELIYEKKRLSILERLAVKGSVGPATGNIRFPGAVQITGSVLSGLQVFAGGDVAVSGTVEAALVSSDGVLIVGEGVKGGKKGTLRAKKSIDAGFIEQALVLAVDDVRIKNSCILCNVKTNGRIILSGEASRMVGGLYRARKGVDTFDLGSPNGIKTEIRFGQDYLVADMIEAEEREIEKLKGLILAADHAMGERSKTQAELDRLRQDKVKMVKLLEKRSIRLFDFREKFEEHFSGAEVRVRGTVYPGVILESHGRFHEVQARKTRLVFTFDKSGRFVEKPL